jgi:DNA-binding response OmpR family regulator
MNVLVVENDASLGLFVKSLLESWGHRAEKCVTGKQALEIFRRGIFDLVLLEALLPDVSGDVLIRQFKEIWPDTMIVAMTENNTRELEVRIREQGILYYMIKPVEVENLRSLLEHLSTRRNPARSGAGT